MKTRIGTRSRLALSLAGLLTCLMAAPTRARADEGDPPALAARISFVEGNVSLQPNGQGDWGAAARNRPTTVGDKIWADKDSRAELQAGQASIHMGSMTALSFLNLDENVMQVRVAEGVINFRVRELREGDLYEIDTPNQAFTVKQAGAFRVEVSEDGEGTRVTAIRGEGEITAGGKTYEVHAGEMAELTGADNPEVQTGQAAPPDGLDRWSAERDLREDNSVSAKYVSRDVPGYDDLDDNGTWNEEPDYGHVWYPSTVAVDWAPYSYGYWNWVGPWGWTWVGYEPWGYAPFHYGRWAYIHNRWGWCPGAYYARPIYGPAFVGFFGGHNWGVSVGFGGGVGWFPLGFGEPFHPWFHCGRGFAERINVRNTVIHNTTIIHNTNYNYVNARNARAVTVASRNSFVNGERINRTSVRVTEASLRGARVNNNIGISPTQRSAFGENNVRGRIATPSAAIQNRTVMARTAPAAPGLRSQVRTMNTTNLSPGRAAAFQSNSRGSGSPRSNNVVGRTQVSAGRPGFGGNVNSSNNTAMSSRQSELSRNRPPSVNGGLNSNNRAEISRSPATNPNVNRPNNARSWEAQGNTTDRGRGPQGFGSVQNGGRSNNVPSQSNSPQGARYSRSDRPSWAGSGSNGGASNGGARSTNSPTLNNNNRPAYSNDSRSYNPPSRTYSNQGNARSYEPPSRSYSNPNSGRTYSNQNNGRTYEAPSRSYSAPRSSYPSSRPSYSQPAPRSYSAPSHSNSAPSRSYSAPSHSSGGGSGAPRSTGGGGSRGGSSSHGGGRAH
jgi:hypothetical protein